MKSPPKKKRDNTAIIEKMKKIKNDEYELIKKGLEIKPVKREKIVRYPTLPKIDEYGETSSSMSKKVNAINKIKKFLSPFVNRISADIYTRVRYMMMMRKELKKIIKEDYGCLKIYKKNPDGTFKYRIGSHIILNKRIGSSSRYGEAYLSEFRDKSKKLLTFVSKIYEYDDEKTMKEIKLLELVTNKVRMS